MDFLPCAPGDGIFRVPFNQKRMTLSTHLGSIDGGAGLPAGSEFLTIREGELRRISSVTVETGPQKRSKFPLTVIPVRSTNFRAKRRPHISVLPARSSKKKAKNAQEYSR
jgi:hypothetical protein